MIKEDVLQYLKDNLYIISQGDGYVISNKFTRELGIPSSNSKPVTTLPTLKPAIATKEIYKLFIQQAEVPTKIETTNGSYWANRYSEAGFKAFKKVFDDPKISRPLLLAATKWYYAQTRTARKMIGTYFSEGIWESCYDDFVKARENRDKKTTVMGNPAPDGYPLQGVWTPKIVDENASNMELG